MKKVIISGIILASMLAFGAAFAEDKGTTIGGHIKLNVYDYATGEVNGAKGTQSDGTGIKEFIMYVKKELSDTLALEVSPKLSWTTSSTPKVATKNSAIGQQLTSDSTTSLGVETLFFEKQLPDRYTARLGYFIPRFTWDYGQELFWEEEYNGAKAKLNIAAYHDSGLELYKEYTISGLSLPTYLYLLSGNGSLGQNFDNGSFVFGFNVEPTVYGVKTHYAMFANKYDKHENAQYKNAIGAEYKTGPYEFRGEAVYNFKQNGLYDGANQRTYGYILKSFYKVCPDLKLMLEYNLSNSTGYKAGVSTDTMSYIYKDLGLGAIYNLSEGTLLQAKYEISDWRNFNGAAKTIFNRFNVGMRTTF